MKRVIFGLVLLASVIAGGCGSMGSLTGNHGAKLAVQYAVYKYTQGEPERAARVREVVNEASELLERDVSVTVPALKAAIIKQVDLTKLDPADQFLALGVIDAVAFELAERVGDGKLNSEKLLRVKQVLEWVLEQAQATAYLTEGA
jgi:chorismate mutase